jgi:hypothetical protein
MGRENKMLRRTVEELENRLMIFIKAYNLEDEVAMEK